MEELVDQKPNEKSQENSKVQLAESYHEFLLNAACKERPENELKRGNAEMQAQQAIDIYLKFFEEGQNREVMTAALEHVAEVMVKFQEAGKYGLTKKAASYFDTKFKQSFYSLEKSISNNWRMHMSFYNAVGDLAAITESRQEAKDLV